MAFEQAHPNGERLGSEPQEADEQEIMSKSPVKKMSHKKYTPEQMADFFDDTIAILGANVSELARKHDINPATAQRWVRDFLETGKIPVDISRGIKGVNNKFQEVHADYLSEKLDEHRTITLDQMIDSLSEKFLGLS